MNEHHTTTTHKCANVSCIKQIPLRYRFCLTCDTAHNLKRTMELELNRRLRSELITEYRSDKLRAAATVLSEKTDAEIVISFDGVKHVFEDRGDMAARKFARQRAIERAQQAQREAEAKIKADLLAGFVAGTPLAGAKITFSSGPQVIVTYQGKSYTMYDEEGLARRGEDLRINAINAALDAERKRQAEAERQAAEERRAEAERQRQLRLEAERLADAEEKAQILAQIKDGTLDPDAIVEREGLVIHILFPDDREMCIDDPDALAAEKQARAESEAIARAVRDESQKSDNEVKKVIKPRKPRVSKPKAEGTEAKAEKKPRAKKVKEDEKRVAA